MWLVDKAKSVVAAVTSAVVKTTQVVYQSVGTVAMWMTDNPMGHWLASSVEGLNLLFSAYLASRSLFNITRHMGYYIAMAVGGLMLGVLHVLFPHALITSLFVGGDIFLASILAIELISLVIWNQEFSESDAAATWPTMSAAVVLGTVNGLRHQFEHVELERASLRQWIVGFANGADFIGLPVMLASLDILALMIENLGVLSATPWLVLPVAVATGASLIFNVQDYQRRQSGASTLRHRQARLVHELNMRFFATWAAVMVFVGDSIAGDRDDVVISYPAFVSMTVGGLLAAVLSLGEQLREHGATYPHQTVGVFSLPVTLPAGLLQLNLDAQQPAVEQPLSRASTAAEDGDAEAVAAP